MNVDLWGEWIRSSRIEDSPACQEIVDTIHRIHWRLIKREQRNRARTVPLTEARIPDARQPFDEVEWRIIVSQLPPTEADVVTLVVLKSYTERETASLMGCSRAHIHQMKKQALVDLRVLFDG